MNTLSDQVSTTLAAVLGLLPRLRRSASLQQPCVIEGEERGRFFV